MKKKKKKKKKNTWRNVATDGEKILMISELGLKELLVLIEKQKSGGISIWRLIIASYFNLSLRVMAYQSSINGYTSQKLLCLGDIFSCST